MSCPGGASDGTEDPRIRPDSGMKRRRRSMRWARRARQVVEKRVIRWITPVVSFLPRHVLYMLAYISGTVVYYLVRRDRRIAHANLKIAFGDSLSLSERRRIILASFRHFALLTLDIFWFSRDTANRIRAHVRPGDGWHHYTGTAPLVCVTGHIGNWEMLGMGTAVLGYPMSIVATPLQNAYADEAINRVRESSGVKIVPRKGAVRVLLRALQRGDSRVALLMDQNTPPHEGGAFEKFFGLDAPISLAIELLVRHTHTKVLVGWCVPDGRGDYVIHMMPPFPVDGETMSPRDVTLRVIAQLEAAIRRHPENWLWSYRRWRQVPPDGDASKYPFYAGPYRVRRERRR